MNSAEYANEVAAILSGQHVTSADPTLYAAHYGAVELPRLFLSKNAENSLRLYDGDCMNDPEEGRYLVDVLIRAARGSKHRYAGAFVDHLSHLRRARLLYPAYRRSTFLSCWTTSTVRAGYEDSADSLNHWRFYGRDGTGTCLIVPVTHLVSLFPDSLYRVIYGTEARGGGLTAENRPVKRLETAFKARLDSARNTYQLAMTDLHDAIQATHPLLFLFKSKEYEAEDEVRVVVHRTGYSLEAGVEFDERTPSQAYVRSQSGVLADGCMIYFGPKADRKLAIEAMGLAENRGIDCRVVLSSLQYR